MAVTIEHALLLLLTVLVGLASYKFGRQHEFDRLRPYIDERDNLALRLKNCRQVIVGMTSKNPAVPTRLRLMGRANDAR